MQVNQFGAPDESPSASWPIDIDAMPPSAWTANRLLKTVCREWRIFLLTSLFTLIGSGTYYVMAPRQYSATAIVMAAPRQADLARTDSVNGAVNPDRQAEGVSDIEGELQLMNAPSSLRRIAHQLGLDSPSFLDDGFSLASLMQPVMARLGLSESDNSNIPESERLLSMAADKIGKSLSAKAIGRSTMVEVSYTARTPELAAKIANAVTQNYIDARFRARVDTAEQASKYLRNRTVDLLAEAVQSDQKVAEYEAASVLAGRDLAQLKQGLDALNVRVIAARADEARAVSQATAAEELVRTQGPRVMLEFDANQGAEQYLAQQRAAAVLRGDADRLAVTTGSYNPQAIRIHELANALDRQLDQAGSAKLAAMKVRVKAAAWEVESLDLMIKDQRTKEETLQARQVKLTALQHNAAASYSVFESFVSRAKATEQVGFNEAQGWVVSPASVPLHQSWPNAAVIGLTSLIASTGFGLTAALFRDLRGRQVFRSIDDVDMHLGLKYLGLLPRLPKASKGLMRQVKSTFSGADFLLTESAKSIYRNILFSLARPNNTPSTGHVVLVTSSLPNEGKSTATAVVAAIAASAGKRVLIIDCDVRSPTIETAFAAKTCSVSERQTALAPQDLVFRDAETGISILAASRVRKSGNSFNPSDVAFPLAALRDSFDLVLIDSPPLSWSSDARELAQLADQTVLTICWGRTRKRTTQLALRQLKEANIVPAGVVFSLVNMKKFALFDSLERDGLRGGYRHTYLPAGASAARLTQTKL